jgi:DNA-binding LacI/PurR family transcriptional regulator
VTDRSHKAVSLKELSAILQLSQSTVSRVLNGSAKAHRIAPKTQERVFRAASKYGYSANTVARSLRQKRSFTLGVIVPELSEGYSTTVLSGIEDELLKEGFFYFVVSHHHRADLLKEYVRMMLARAVEGIITVDTLIEDELSIPLVSISGHELRNGMIGIELAHKEAARLALEHLMRLGHKRIAFIKGQQFSSDSEVRWQSIVGTAQALRLPIDPKLVVQLCGEEPGSGPGLEVTKQLLKTKLPFTALFAFNDMSAIGAIQALREAGLHVPRDVSVVGFDDVLIATTSNPPLTTIHQPLRAMGQAGASTLLDRIRNPMTQWHPSVITVHPKLVVRESTGPAVL